MTTTWSDHTVASAISRLQSSQETALPERNRTGRCATSRAPRPALLLRRANKAQINPGLYSSLDESWGSGHRGRSDFLAMNVLPDDCRSLTGCYVTSQV